MAIAVASRTHYSSNTAEETMTTASFTPTANSYLYIVVSGVSSSDSSAPAWSVSGGSLTWTAVSGGTITGSGSFRNDWTTYRASVGSSPSSMTITVDKYSSSSTTVWYGAAVFDVTGLDSTTQEDQVDTGITSSGSHTQTRTGTPAEHQVCVWIGELTEGTDDGAWASVDETNWSRITEKSDTDCTRPSDLWESSNGTLTSMTQSITSSGTEFSVGAVWIELNPSADTTADATVASATGSGQNATAEVGPSAGSASATGAGHDATPDVVANAEVASATGAAHDPNATVDVTAESGSATGQAHDSTVDVGPIAEVAIATATGLDPSTIVSFEAGTAAATGSGHDPDATIGPDAGSATGSGDGFDAEVTVDPNPLTGEATGAGHDPAAGIEATGLVATATGTAHDATVIIGPAAETAVATGTAHQPSVETSPTITDVTAGAWFGRHRYHADFGERIEATFGEPGGGSGV